MLAMVFPSCVWFPRNGPSVRQRERRRELNYGSRVFLPPENGNVLHGHKPKPRGHQSNPPPAMKKNYLGMDIAADSAVAQLEGADGSRYWRAKVTADVVGWKQLTEALDRAHIEPANLVVIMEATGVHHLCWAERLRGLKAEVYVLNPLLAARLASVDNALRDNKTDPIDVAKLCEIGRLYLAKLERFRFHPVPERIALTQLDHVRVVLRCELTNLRKSVKSHLQAVFPALTRAGIQAWSARGRRILAQAPTAGTWQALLAEQRAALAGGKQKRLDEAAAATIADETIARACAPALTTLLATELVLAGQLEACEQRIGERLPAKRVALITSIPGFGEPTARVMATYLPDDVTKWGSRKHIVARLQALFGTDPRLRRSGNWIGREKISKRGIASARTALFQAAFGAVVHDPPSAAYYDQLRQKGKSHRAALVDVMRKQLRRLVAVLCSGEPYTSHAPPRAPVNAVAC